MDPLSLVDLTVVMGLILLPLIAKDCFSRPRGSSVAGNVAGCGDRTRRERVWGGGSAR